MKKHTFLSILFLLLFSNAQFAQNNNEPLNFNEESPKSTKEMNSLAEAAAPVSLFDGKTLNGWVQIPANSWVVKDGVIASLGSGRGVLYTTNQYENYRLMFSVKHISGNPDHKPAVLFFCTAPEAGQKAADALAGLQFQVPTGSTWDYRVGFNNPGDSFAIFPRGPADFHQWSRVELLVNAKAGTARIAVAQPFCSTAIEVGSYKNINAGRKGPIAFQMHNATLLDEYKDITIEVNPVINDLISTKNRQVSPFMKVNDGGMIRNSTAKLKSGDNLVLSPLPTIGSWSWIGPNGFTADTREISFQNIDVFKAGVYTTTCNWDGCYSSTSFLVKVEDPSAIGEIHLINTDPKIYPNPALDFVTITNVSANTPIVVSDLVGQILLRTKSTDIDGDFQLDISDLLAGTYCVTTGSGRMSKLFKR